MCARCPCSESKTLVIHPFCGIMIAFPCSGRRCPEIAMNKYLVFLVAIFVGSAQVSLAQGTLRAYYEGGDAMEQITDHGVTLTVTLRDNAKENWIWIYVANDSNDAVNIIPANIKLHQNLPKEEDLRMKTERELGKSVDHKVFWGQIAAGIGAGLRRNVSVARTRDAYGNSFTTTVNTPDYEAQARWLAWADQLAQKGQAIKDFHQREWLRANTLFPGSQYAGRLIFVRDKKLESGTIRVSLDSRDYDFPFPPPQSARPPTLAPQLPVIGNVTLSPASRSEPESVKQAVTENQQSAEPEHMNSTERAGVFGVSGANWEERGSTGVEILGVADNSAADIGGLRVGYVITDVNGRKIRSTRDLALFLSQNGPGSKVTVGYIFKSNLGWMPKETVVVLTNGN